MKRLVSRLAWSGYQLALGGALVLTAPWVLLRRGGHYRRTILPRLGRVPEAPVPGGLWIHAVSVGEVMVAATLAQALPETLPLVVTTVTPTGQARAQASLGRRATVTYLPFELGFAVERFFRRLAPAALVLVEGDLWPLVLERTARRRLPVTVVNGRVSDRSFRRMTRLRRLLGGLLGPLFTHVGRFGMQTAEDRRRLIELGVSPAKVAVTGNLKYESPEPAANTELEAQLRRLAGDRPLLVAGSTMAGEEEAVLDALEVAGGGEAALLVVAPRHPERWDEVARLLDKRGIAFLRRSGWTSPGSSPRPAVVLLDSLGELAGLYRIAAAAFIGGTLVATGGHNPLEPARFAVATAVGPSMENFREMAEHFDRAEAWARVGDAAALGETWRRWLEEPSEAAAVGRRAQALVEANRGSLERTLKLLEPLLAAVSARPAGSRS
ncbi:MAG: 3-deoxy-D-manno-octulosonic acid transferase [Acidobacteria bacterium]|nr:3-deoxy-D-manno-octulosonic acid transferase [Acidobacteriota bacterium]